MSESMPRTVDATPGARSELPNAPAPTMTGGPLTPTQLLQLQRLAGNRAVGDLVARRHAVVGTAAARRALVARQNIVTGPGGPDPCDALLQAIIDLLNEVAQRYNDALNDPHGLFENHRTPKDAHPDYGSWEGHKDRYDYDRGRLRQKLAEWEADDRCRGRPLTREQQEDLREAEEFGNKSFPARPVPSMSRSTQQDSESVWDRLRRHLPEYLVAALIAIGAVAAGVAIAACFGSGACEFALALAGLGVIVAGGIAAAMRAAGIRDEPATA